MIGLLVVVDVEFDVFVPALLHRKSQRFDSDIDGLEPR